MGKLTRHEGGMGEDTWNNLFHPTQPHETMGKIDGGLGETMGKIEGEVGKENGENFSSVFFIFSSG